MEGVGPVKDVDMFGRSKGLNKHWHSNKQHKWKKRRGEIEKGNFWDVIDNPLYQVAAEAKGYDWDDWVKESKGKVGTGPNDGTARVRAVIKAGTSGGTRTIHGDMDLEDEVVQTSGTPAEYEWMTVDEAKSRGLDYEAAKTSRWRNKKTGKIHEAKIDPNANRTKSSMYSTWGDLVNKDKDKDWEDDWEELRDWGVHDQGVAEDLDEISDWLIDIVNVNDHIPKIIREGPKGKHYGIEGDIWKHYGLDKEPEPPKELDWDSAEKNMQLASAVTSDVSYSTPEGITPVDLHSDA